VQLCGSQNFMLEHWNRAIPKQGAIDPPWSRFSVHWTIVTRLQGNRDGHEKDIANSGGAWPDQFGWMGERAICALDTEGFCDAGRR
jgi:hypothetical protein